MATSPINASSGSTNYINVAEQKAATAGTQPDQQMFLKLLVEQIRNQDPMNPMDGTDFIAQLAQFSQLEQTIAIRQDADYLKEAFSQSADNAEAAPPANE